LREARRSVACAVGRTAAPPPPFPPRRSSGSSNAGDPAIQGSISARSGRGSPPAFTPLAPEVFTTSAQRRLTRARVPLVASSAEGGGKRAPPNQGGGWEQLVARSGRRGSRPPRPRRRGLDAPGA